ncbi:hypothetical protein JCM10450v2_002004 [Rhodotorula kratochvilovae]
MPPAKLPCVVCGESTTQRCSSCAKAGTGWIAFCSADHQRLACPTHKRVCGAKGNPPYHPSLTPDEIEFALVHRDGPYVSNHVSITELAREYLPNMGRETERGVRVFLESLKEGDEGIPRLRQDPLIAVVRTAIVRARLEVGACLKAGVEMISALSSQPWMSGYRHRTLLALDAIDRIFQSDEAVYHDSPLFYPVEAARSFIKTVVAPQSPLMADALNTYLDVVVIVHFPTHSLSSGPSHTNASAAPPPRRTPGPARPGASPPLQLCPPEPLPNPLPHPARWTT